MASSSPLARHLAPDCVIRLERAARSRFEEADELARQKRRLAAVYLYGYCVEMCLAAAFFRCDGFSPLTEIDRETRQRRMAQARQLRLASGEPMMNGDPHPLVGWAKFLQWRRERLGPLKDRETQRLREAVHKAGQVYRHWRPELRYKVSDVTLAQLNEVREAASWFLEEQGRL